MNIMNRWYDSRWLNQFLAAKFYITNKHADRLGEFESAFQPLRTRADFRTVKSSKILDDQILKECRQQLRSLEIGDLEKQELFQFGRLIKHDLPFFTEMQSDLTNWLSGIVGEELEPSYNFLSLYNNLGVCPLHMDSPEAKWTLDICIDQSSEWPIHISNVVGWPEQGFDQDEPWPEVILNDPSVNFSEYTHEPGDALVFSGSSQWHYRSRIPVVANQNFAHLIFFHFTPKGTNALIRPSLWSEIFDIQGLSEVVGKHSENRTYDFDVLKQRYAKQEKVKPLR